MTMKLKTRRKALCDVVNLLQIMPVTVLKIGQYFKIKNL